MWIILICLLLCVFSSGCGNFSTRAQIRSSSNGKISDANSSSVNQNNSSDKKTTRSELAAFDFKNFTYPDLFSTNGEKTFTLKNGEFKPAGANQSPNFVYKLRKTYFFDVTGDKSSEAITHIMVGDCEGLCNSRSLFFVYTAEDAKPKLIWKIATGIEEAGGLKSITFKEEEIIVETFGNSSVKDWMIEAIFKPEDAGKPGTEVFTRFVFSMTENDFSQTSKEVLPLKETYNTDYRVKINFGSPD